MADKDLERLLRRFRSEFGDEVGLRIEQVMISEVGGKRLTIPSAKHIYARDLRRQVLDRFNGSNHGELAMLFGINRTTVYRIVASADGKGGVDDAN